VIKGSRTALLAALLLGTSAVAAPLAPSLQHRIDADVRASLHRFDTPGAVIAVVRDGQFVYAHSYGLRDTVRHLPVRIDTHFEIGSITKQFTVAAILQLREKGALDIDAKVSTYLPDAPHAAEVTLRQLMSHVSGLPDYLDGPDVEQAAVKPATFDDLMGRIKDKPLDFAPGAKWAYSNTNYAMLGRIVEIVSHRSYHDYVKTHLLDAAGMTHTFTVADEPRIAGMAVGYRHVDKRLELAPTIHDSFGWAAGNIVSTVADLGKWNAALRSGKIVSPGDYAMMATSVTTPQGDAGYGLGLFVDRIDGQKRIGHTGDSFGFTTANEYFPDRKLQIIAFTNSGDDGPEPGETLTRIVFDDLYPGLAARTARPAPGADPATTALVEKVFVTLEGANADYGPFAAHLGDKLKAGLGERLAKEFASYGPPTAAIFKGARTAGDLKWADYLLQFGPGCSLPFSVGLDGAGKIASLSFG
jgi:CubicO group peptidase (beta-lactamase class C family)